MKVKNKLADYLYAYQKRGVSARQLCRNKGLQERFLYGIHAGSSVRTLDTAVEALGIDLHTFFSKKVPEEVVAEIMNKNNTEGDTEMTYLVFIGKKFMGVTLATPHEITKRYEQLHGTLEDITFIKTDRYPPVETTLSFLRLWPSWEDSGKNDSDSEYSGALKCLVYPDGSVEASMGGPICGPSDDPHQGLGLYFFVRFGE